MVIPMSELVKDPVYKKFLLTKPRTPSITRDERRAKSPPWVVYVQRDSGGSWGKREFWTYAPAFRFFKAWLEKGAHDLALNNKRFPFDPPTRFARIRGKYVVGSDGVRRQATKKIPWQPKLAPGDPDHYWCRYCRRPTVFKYYKKHRRLGFVDPEVRRCCICGASERIAMTAKDRRH